MRGETHTPTIPTGSSLYEIRDIHFVRKEVGDPDEPPSLVLITSKERATCLEGSWHPEALLALKLIKARNRKTKLF